MTKPRKIYVLYEYYFDDCEIMGATSLLKTAKAWAKRKSKPKRGRPSSNARSWIETTLDGKLK
jgi:hypothetical protein